MSKENILDIIDSAGEAEIIAGWNYYCDETDRYEEKVYDNENETYEMMFGSIDDALRAAYYGDFNYTDDYCCLNAYGNLNSFHCLSDGNCPIDKDELAEWFTEHEDELEDWFNFDPDDYEEDDDDDDDNGCYLACPECGKRLEFGEYKYDHDSGRVRVVTCSECGCSGEVVKLVDPTDDDNDDTDINED